MEYFRRKRAVTTNVAYGEWYFSTVRWLPLGILLGAGLTNLAMQVREGAAINWLFPLVCAVFGVLLFRWGCVLRYCH